MFSAATLINRRSTLLGTGAVLLAAGLADEAQAVATGVFEDVRRHGARGDGVAIDSPAINRAIETAAKRGGGTVVVPAGRYLCFTLRLRDNIALVLSAGATIVAANPDTHGAHYDPPENYREEQFQDFGITHVHNSLIRGDGVSNVSILGPGMLHGLGLDREGPGDRWHARRGWQSAAALGITPRELALRDPKERAPVGRANKTIGLMNCRNVRLDGFTILQAGHFGIIAHGCTNMQIDGVVIDTDRDGIDIDACRDVRVVNCTVNAPKDDAIVLKSSYALGRAVMCEDILISGCKTSGYAMGSLLDGSYRASDYLSPDKLGPLGRIKLGTETNGGFRNVRISDCICTNSRGILMGIVDGGTLEDVSVSGIILRDPVNHPLFVHHGARMRAPRGTPVGRIRRVRFEDVTVSGAHSRFPCGVEGIADAPVEDVTFRNIDIAAQGGGTREDASRVPEYRRETSLEVSYLGTLPAAGFYARHARRLTIRDVSLRTAAADARPVIALRNVEGAIVDGIASPMLRDAVLDTRDSRDVALGEVTTWGD
ncbi:rhamnogalacturonidase [Sphingomonas psychrotolerans]|uniref:Glycoside hydrolase n=1 Tax=Sphingomonas psychrotolerans TaxID=1327635 RepID=A0A2K8MHU9_9SPHN|nr:glycosyl hydrolase family 28-related protein [Sphingomonas psychrotolerans]ATY33457.1 glycoside hydrolase [Sphingomonas psychrotolerans]